MITQKIANRTASAIDEIAKTSFYRNKIAEVIRSPGGRVEDAKLLRMLKIKDETPEDKDKTIPQQKLFTKLSSGIQDMGKNLGDFLGNITKQGVVSMTIEDLLVLVRY